MPIEVAIVSRRQLFAEALETLLSRDGAVRVVARHLVLAHALVASPPRPDVVLVTLDCLGPDHGLAASLTAPGAPRLIVIADSGDAVDMKQLLRAGVAGVVLTTMPASLLFAAIAKVHEGELWLERNAVLEHFRREAAAPLVASLSGRESEIFRCACDGLRNHEIAERLAITDSTVKAHMTHIFRKLHLKNRLDLFLLAQKWREGANPS